MKKFLIRHRPIVTFVLSLAESVLIGIWGSLIAGKILEGISFFESVKSIPSSRGFISLIFIIIIIHIYIEILCAVSDKQAKAKLVNSILKEACDSYIYPHKEYHIRSMITVCDYRRMKRKVIYSYNIIASPERFGEYDISFGVTGKAWSRRCPVAEELKRDHMDHYAPNIKQFVESRLKCVLAAPIFSKTEKGKVIAVLAFDSMETLDTMKFDSDKSKEIAQSWADILSNIIE